MKNQVQLHFQLLEILFHFELKIIDINILIINKPFDIKTRDFSDVVGNSSGYCFPCFVCTLYLFGDTRAGHKNRKNKKEEIIDLSRFSSGNFSITSFRILPKSTLYALIISFLINNNYKFIKIYIHWTS